jgi:hypothetical protein
MCVGIENRNAGQLVKRGDKFYWWGKNWSAEFPKELEKTPVFLNGQYWEPYTKEQIKANILIGRALQSLTMAEGGLSKNWVIPHSCVSNQKTDTGPAFPMHEVRDAIFSTTAIDDFDFIMRMAGGPVQVIYFSQEDVSFSELSERQAGRNSDEELTDVDYKKTIGTASADAQLLVQGGDWKGKLDSVRKALSTLEYYVTGSGSVLDLDTSTAVQFFQRAFGLKFDGVPGDVTQKAIHERMKSLGLLPGVPE